METINIDIITIVFFGLGVLSLVFAIWALYAFTRPIGDDRVQLIDDAPGRYEDFEEVFYNP